MMLNPPPPRLPLLSVVLVLVLSPFLDALEVSVSTAPELLSALGTPSVTLIRLLQDIQLDPEGVIPGANASSSIYALGRNVTITTTAGSTAPDDWYPTLDLHYASAKLRLPDGVALALQHITLWRLSTQIGILDLDFIDPSSTGTVLMTDVVFLSEGCLPASTMATSFSDQASRPASIDGTQSAGPRSNDWCPPPQQPPPAAAAANASSGCVSASRTFAVMDWALSVAYWDQHFGHAPANAYVVWARDLIWVCDQIFSNDCLFQYGSVSGCWSTVLRQAVAAANVSSPAPAPPPRSGSAGGRSVSVYTEPALLAALADPTVTVIYMLESLQMSPDTLIPDADASTGLYTLTRNVTISAAAGKTAATDWYPTLDFLFSPSKLLLPAGVTLELKHLYLKRTSQQVGIFDVDFIDRNSMGTLIETDTVFLNIGCLPVDGTAASFSQQSTRFPGIPGNQSAAAPNTPWCEPPRDPSAAASNCTSGNMTFTIADVALNMTFWDSRVGRLYNNKYAVWVRDSRWICGQIFSSACVAQYGSVFKCWAGVLYLAVRDAGRSTTPPPPGFLTTVQDVSVTTESDLLAALGDANTSVIRVLRDIQLSRGSIIPGADSSSGVYQLSRNVTITTTAGQTLPTDWYPTLDFHYTGPKLHVPAGLALYMQHLFIKRTSRQVGIFNNDFVESTSLGAIVRTDVVYLSEACQAVDTTVAALTTQASRAPSIPGTQSASPLPGGWCAPPLPGGGNGTNGSCWDASTSLFIADVAVNVSFWESRLATPRQDLFLGWTRNSTWLCAQIFGSECVTAYGGVAGCWGALLAEAVRATDGALLPPGALSPPQPAPPPGGGGDGSGGFPGWAIGVIVGAVVLLAIVLSGFGAVMWRRRQQDEAQRVRAASSLEVLVPKGELEGLHHRPSSAGPGSSIDLVKGDTRVWDSLNFSSASCRGNMIDEADSTTASAVSRPALPNVDPGELMNQMSTKSALMRDEQLELVKVLGRGGGGIVYQGLWKGLPVAAKVMIVHEEQHDQARRQILEATMSTSLSHPNIVNTYNYDLRRLGSLPNSEERPVLGQAGAFATAWQLVILQELCRGGPLRRMMDQKAAPGAEARLVDQRHVLLLAHDISSGLEHLHLKNVIHSDMTANNVLLQTAESPRPAGLQWVAKVADFGLSNAMEDGRSQISHVFAGTPHYIAPETQAKGIISKSSDIFAFGILMYEMMVGSSVGNNYSHTKQLRSQADLPQSTTTPEGVSFASDAAAPAAAVAATAAAMLPPPAKQLMRGDSASAASMVMAPRVLTGKSAKVSSPVPSVIIEISEEEGPTSSAGLLATAVSGGGGSGGTPTVGLSPAGSSAHVLMGGGRGHHGGSLVLPPLPASCPPEYVSLVEACLSPEPQERPTIAIVRRRLTALVKVYVLDDGDPGVADSSGFLSTRVTHSGNPSEDVSSPFAHSL